MRALPNAAKIGFTGTPIMNRDRGNTLNIFDDFIDKYSMKQAQEDEATVPILYEGRVPLGLLENSERLDTQVPVRFAEFTEPEQQIIMQKFAAERKVMEAPKLSYGQGLRHAAPLRTKHSARGLQGSGCRCQPGSGCCLPEGLVRRPRRTGGGGGGNQPRPACSVRRRVAQAFRR